MSSAVFCPVGAGGVPKPMSASTIVVGEAVEGSHVLTIHGFSRQKGLDKSDFFKSGVFNIGDYSWFIVYYPQGYGDDNADWITLFVTLAEIPNTQLKVHVRCSLLDHTGDPVPQHTSATDAALTSQTAVAFHHFIERKVLQESPYLKDDCFRVRCDITVKSGAGTHAEIIAVPPSDMHHHIGGLLSSQEGVDVTFEVDGETIGAHRIVLAARSSVFKAQLFGPMKEKNMSHIRIDDMEASVFKAMLHFVYNDTLPDIDKEDMTAMAQHLLVAADRYRLERLKLICEEKLWYNISTGTLATTLALAEQHGCQGLKEACFEFLKTTTNLKAVLESDGFQHLRRSFPSFPMELVAQLFPSLFIDPEPTEAQSKGD